ncbi:glycosyl hydrolase family 18 protein [Glycomyces paridis]|uniref:chitinase n=1 Tax=Glycomyces paridis TaxID=2126555 RepID=A0A4S8NXN4_9ACTN|nr:glycosyl hydrolase family 18 protein [Glycomyces paridis]THV21705.1 chitinase [Glycomyces paridis]
MTAIRRALPALASLLLFPLLLLAAPASAQTQSLTATFVAADYGSYWQAKYVIANPGSTPVTGWTLEFDLPEGAQLGQVFYGKATQSGRHVTIVNEHYNATVPAGGSLEPYSPWILASSSAEPTGCLINGDKCDGTPADPPSAPANLRSTARTTTSVTLAWDAAAQGDHPVDHYEVLSGGTVAATTSATNVVVSGLTPASANEFTVRAVDVRGGAGAESAPVTVETLDPADDTVAPSAPTGLQVAGVTSGSVTLTWAASSDASGIAGYDVYRDGEYATSTAQTSAVVAGLAPVSTYEFTVVARDSYDNASAHSAPVTAVTDDAVGAGEHAKVGYFVQWGIYGRQYFVKNLDTSGAAAKLTHVNYAFSNIDPVNLTCMNGVTKGTTPDPQDPNQGTGAGDAEADYGRAFSASQSVDGVGDTGWEPLRGNFNELLELKEKHPHLKVLMSIGGWTYSKYFSDVAATEASREKFVASCIDLYIEGNLPAYNGAGGDGVAAGVFDGIDLDWEWPGAEGHPGNNVSAADKENNTLLMAEFRRQLDALSADTGKDYLLTAFTPADPAKVDAGWDITTTDGTPSVFDYMDFANVQGYDFHGSGSDNSWEPNLTGHQANQTTDVDDPYSFHFSNEIAIGTYLDAGVHPRQLTIGIPFYGRGWQGVTAGGVNGEWQSATGAAPGQFAEEAGTRGYANLKAMVPGCTVYHDVQAGATYCFTGNGGQWWSFDDPWAIGLKTDWVAAENLLGVMVWEMSGDDGTLMSAIDTGLS